MGRGVRPERPGGPGLRAHRRFPPALGPDAQAELKAAIQAPPRTAGIDLADWNWKVVREFVRRRCGLILGRSSCLNYLHRLGFVLKRPEKRLLKADAARREEFVREYALLWAAARATGATIFFADEAHSYADADLHGKWVLKGEPAPVDSTSPRWGEKASSYSAGCLESGEVEAMELDRNSSAETSVRFLQQLRANHPGPLLAIWATGPAHGGEALRSYLSTPNLHLRLVRLPAYSPDFNADEAIGGWVREEVTANTCFGTKAKGSAAVGQFFRDLPSRAEEVKRRRRTVLQVRAEALMPVAAALLQTSRHVDPTLALV